MANTSKSVLAGKSRKLKPSSLPFDQRLTLSIEETADMLGVGKNTIRSLIDAGKLKAVKLGARRPITVSSIYGLLGAEPAVMKGPAKIATQQVPDSAVNSVNAGGDKPK